MKPPKEISIEAYDYGLPEERIARFPLEVRDESNLLLFNKGHISHSVFKELPYHLPERALLVFNDTKVIHARMYFTLPNGSRLEILCLEPLEPIEHQQNFSSTGKVRWKCLVGGNRKWKQGIIKKELQANGKTIWLKATRLERLSDSFDILFEWSDATLAFGELLALAGIIPLPPYLNRAAEASDEKRYQTVYAQEEGSVAAPTAGLHFTETVFDALKTKGFQRLFLTLHVGAGTFKPVRASRLAEHHMHEESIFISRDKLAILHQALQEKRPIIPVGTTSMRILESLYWYALQLEPKDTTTSFHIPQWAPYEQTPTLSSGKAIARILQKMDEMGQDAIKGQTQIIIAPGYHFRLANGLITNFHQPRSTLLLLIAALIGEAWKKVYDYAMKNDFRFLSYGDSSLLLP